MTANGSCRTAGPAGPACTAVGSKKYSLQILSNDLWARNAHWRSKEQSSVGGTHNSVSLFE